MRGIIFALMAGFFITLQGVANARISQSIGTWQAAALTQFTGFIVALIILSFIKEKNWQGFKKVKPIYLFGGAFAAIIIFSNITAIHHIGVTFTIATVLISQLCITFLVDIKGWFGVVKQKVSLPQFIGIGMMVIGIIILKL